MNSGTIVPHNGEPIIIVNSEVGGLKAFSAICTHLACITYWHEDRQVIQCPCHDGRFNPLIGLKNCKLHVIWKKVWSDLWYHKVRTKEIGVMRAIGARTPVLMLMFILEGVLQGLLSWAVSVPLSFVLGRPLATVVGQAMFDVALDYQYNLQAVLVWLITVVIISILASVIPARSATTISVRESLAYA